LDEKDSLERYSSIINNRWERKLNCSEGVAGGRVNSPIRESILNSSRSGSDNHRLTKQRSQHSLIIESVTRILDDSSLEDRIFKKKKGNAALHAIEPAFRTGPPSEVH
jgi:hypothetical protein